MDKFKIYLKENYFNNGVLVGLSLSSAILYYYSSKLMEKIFSYSGRDTKTLNKYLVLFILIYLLLFMILLCITKFESISLFKGGRNFSSFILSKVFYGEYEYYLSKEPTAISSDMNMISNNLRSFYNSIVKGVAVFVEFLIYFIVIFNISKVAALMAIIIGVAVYFISNFVNKRITSYHGRYLNENRELSTLIITCLNLMKNIKAKRREEYFIDKINSKSKKATSYMVSFNFYNSLINRVSFIFSSIAPIIIIYFLMKYKAINLIEKEEIIVVYLFVPLLLNAFTSLFNILIEFYKSIPYISKFQEFSNIIKEKNEGQIIKDFESLQCGSVKVRFKNKLVTIPDMIIKKGDRVIIKGESGKGKSTLFNIILGLVKDYEGTIKVNDIDLKNLNIDSIRWVMGISFQSNGVYSMALKENILLSEEKDIEKILELTELKDLMEKKKDETLGKDVLSGGEMARIAIAQNLIRDPKVILIDESTSSLNIDMERKILEKLLSQYSDKTWIFITHRYSNSDVFTKVIDFDLEEALCLC